MLGRHLECETVERHRDKRRVADEVAEARPRKPRRALHLETPDGGVLGPAGRGLPDPAQLERVVLARPVGGVGVGRVRYPVEELVPPRLRRRELLLGGAQLLLDPRELGELLGARRALALLARTELLDPRESERQRSSAWSRASKASPAPLRTRAALICPGWARAWRRSIKTVSLGVLRSPRRRPPGRRMGRSSRRRPLPARAHLPPPPRNRPIRAARCRSRRRRAQRSGLR